MQLAKHFGAKVTGVCSTRNLDLVRSLGAEKTIDYTQEDFIRREQRYELILDAVGKATRSECQKSLAPNGTCLSVTKGLARDRPEDLVFLRERAEARKLWPVIGGCYPLDHIAEAHRYAETGHRRENVVITVTQ